MVCRSVHLLRALDGLRSTPEIEIGNLVYAGNGAIRRAGLLGDVFAANVLYRVFAQRFAGITALLGAIVDQPILTDIQVAGPSAALPVMSPPIGDIVLEIVDLGV